MINNIELATFEIRELSFGDFLHIIISGNITQPLNIYRSVIAALNRCDVYTGALLNIRRVFFKISVSWLEVYNSI